MEWYGPDHFGAQRASLEGKLEALPGGQLVLVRYSARHNTLDEWVYNGADIDLQKVIWAREMDSASDQELFRYYQDRKVWLVEPDQSPVVVEPYPGTETANRQLPQKTEGASQP